VGSVAQRGRAAAVGILQGEKGWEGGRAGLGLLQSWCRKRMQMPESDN
jgi:hypothetical protein